MKILLFVVILTGVLCSGYCSKYATVSRERNAASVAQFKPSDPMSAEALAATRAAGY